MLKIIFTPFADLKKMIDDIGAESKAIGMWGKALNLIPDDFRRAEV
jgi:hypothetical protein